ncbi:hypothetical protein BABINDRAFT_159523 [Babjeviella inositovora NRRL Y-12698]|uniref:pyridoxal kinase n=1 Tax=Babjeviella inositovora NRRL Y-12698 TaxID=984486 RepID=A0A1E3QZL7_9ASCO|nr:uncharacterized protein BABINDRAFT_159523 [Babjeviella inositovora NRRL Y-12698]ODQ83061.1 hypothetical protein BABINDRAFT_159523 [Babjeviella inositovora NRRL Y-12698]
MLEDILPAKKVLSIQSHVVHGYVGNRAATFPMQCQGWDVDTLNTVNFSNHTGYGQVYGAKTTAGQLRDIYHGLKDIGFRYDALLTGYIPGDEAVQAVGEICVDIKRRDTECIWLLDPVMGDEGQLYVEQSVIPAYKAILRSGLVDIITPNQFEAELLVGFSITDTASLKRCLTYLHEEYNVRHVVISSLALEFPDEVQQRTTCDRADPTSSKSIFAVASSQGIVTLFKIPHIDSYFTGVGDLFSALLLDRVAKHKRAFAENVNEILSVMLDVLHVTNRLVIREVGEALRGTIGSAESMKHCELRIIECQQLYQAEEKYFLPCELK